MSEFSDDHASELRGGTGPGEGGIPSPSGDIPTSGLPRQIEPQLPILVKKAPEGDDWLHELKLDGYRILLRVEGDEARALTRKGHDWSHRFPEVVAAARELPGGGTVVDGEVVVLLPDGTTDFQALQNALDGVDESGGTLVYFAFDLPYYRGRDLTARPLVERKGILREEVESLPGGVPLRYSDHIQGHGPQVLERACGFSLEGIVSKRRDAPYRPGRNRSWLKTKCLRRQEFVVGGWTEPSGSRAHFGALLLGWYDSDERLHYAGRVGTGFTAESLEAVHRRLVAIPAEDSPFSAPPTGADARGVHWVEPREVVEVVFAQWTTDGRIRHPSFQGLRDDRPPQEATRERPMEERHEHPVIAGVRLSNPDRVLYPEQGRTKADLARYYERMADRILPHLVGRPLSLVRCPRGHGQACFYQKHLTEGMPEPIRGVEVEEKEGSALYVAVDNVEGLVTLVQLGVLEIHPWGAREDRLDRPDRLVLDLDPGEGVPWKAVVEAAFEIRERLEDLGLVTYLRTTGGKGVHLVAPLVRRVDWEAVKGFARDLARDFARRHPERFVATSRKDERKGRIYIDYLRNDRGATAIATYSTRARAGAPVATPLRWEELPRLPGPAHYTTDNVPQRVARLGGDPWDGFDEVRQSITKGMRDF